MTWIYFLLIDGERIKIGETGDLKARIRQHERTTLSTHEVDFLAAVQGCKADEGHVQRFFADDAVEELKSKNSRPSEVFIPTPRITNYIRWLRNQWYAVIDVGAEPEGCVSFEHWQPSHERQVPPACYPLFEPDWLEFNDRIVTGDDYYTNPVILECARVAMGGIDLDPASHAMANKRVKATRFYSIQDNGLDQTWSGRVWLNPPFSQWKLWVPKICEESSRVQSMCVYSAMRTITAQYFRRLLDAAKSMCVITGRMKHGGLGGDNPDDGHCVFYFGDSPDKFKRAFSSIGSVWVQHRKR